MSKVQHAKVLQLEARKQVQLARVATLARIERDAVRSAVDREVELAEQAVRQVTESLGDGNGGERKTSASGTADGESAAGGWDSDELLASIDAIEPAPDSDVESQDLAGAAPPRDRENDPDMSINTAYNVLGIPSEVLKDDDAAGPGAAASVLLLPVLLLPVLLLPVLLLPWCCCFRWKKLSPVAVYGRAPVREKPYLERC